MKTSNKLLIGLVAAIFIMTTIAIVAARNLMVFTIH